MSDPVFTGMTDAQRAALITPTMAAMMASAHQTQTQNMTDDAMKAMQLTAARLPVDASGKAFSRFAACVVQQPSAAVPGLPPTLPAALVDARVTVMSTYGERVKVRYLSGEERDFHKSELGVK